MRAPKCFAEYREHGTLCILVPEWYIVSNVSYLYVCIYIHTKSSYSNIPGTSTSYLNWLWQASGSSRACEVSPGRDSRIIDIETL